MPTLYLKGTPNVLMLSLVALEAACAHTGLTYVIELRRDEFDTRSANSVSKALALVKLVEVDRLIILMGPPWRPLTGHKRDVSKCFIYDRLVIRQAG